MTRVWAAWTAVCAALVAWLGGTRSGRARLHTAAERLTREDAVAQLDAKVSRLDRADGVGARVVPMPVQRVPAPAVDPSPTTLAGLAGVDRHVYVQTHRGRAMWVCAIRHPLGLTAAEAFAFAETGQGPAEHVRWVDTSEPDWLRVLQAEARAHRLLCGPARTTGATATADHTDPAA